MPPTRREKQKDTAKKRHWRKMTGFDAFNDKPIRRNDREKNGNYISVICNAIAPETGIHSLEWAQAIAPQTSSLFNRLPYEIRVKIWEVVIKDFNDPSLNIRPQKSENNFKGFLARDTGSLYRICRQAYIDTCGSGLLYKLASFHFPSPSAMMNYVSVINPIHKDAIRTISLEFELNHHRTRLAPMIAFETLSSMKGLRSLAIKIQIAGSLLNPAHDQHSRYFGRSPQRTFDYIRKYQGWAMIKDLQEFILTIDGYSQTRGHPDDARRGALEKEIRDAVLGNKSKSVTSGSM